MILSHLNSIKQSTEKSKLTHIVLTHSHQDHCASAIRLSSETNAPIYIYDNQNCSRTELLERIKALSPLLESKKEIKNKVIVRSVNDGDKISNNEWCLEVIATPGHTFDHICLALKGSEVIFTGDHVMGWSSTVVIPPMGDMGQFILSLKKLLDRHENIYLPAHGPEITDAKSYVQAQLSHKKHRQNQILELLQVKALTPKEIANHIYPNIDTSLQVACESNIYAHLLELLKKNIAVTYDKTSISSRFFLV